MNTRRRLVIALGVGGLLAPLASLAQKQPKIWRIGLFHVGLDHVPPSLDGLRDGLNALGYVEGKNLHLDWRNLADEDAALAAAQAFVRDRVDLIVAFEGQTIDAAHAATRDIPIVILHIADPVADGIIKSLAHPGGNITGFAGIGDIPSEELELFKELMPALKRPLVLFDANDPTSVRWLADLRQAAPKLRLQLIERQAFNETDIKRVFALRLGNADGVFIASPHLRVKFHALILELASQRRLPLLGHRGEWVERGALFSYNVDLRAVGFAAAARYVDRILKGVKPADLPVEQVSQYQLIVNRKTANAYGITIPQSIFVRADKVIE